MAAFAGGFFWGGTSDEPLCACSRELLVAGDGFGTDQWSEVGFRQKRIARLKFADRCGEQFLEVRRNMPIDEDAARRIAALSASETCAFCNGLSSERKIRVRTYDCGVATAEL